MRTKVLTFFFLIIHASISFAGCELVKDPFELSLFSSNSIIGANGSIFEGVMGRTVDFKNVKLDYNDCISASTLEINRSRVKVPFSEKLHFSFQKKLNLFQIFIKQKRAM